MSKYEEKRAAENRGACSSCLTPDKTCTARIVRGRGACCDVCQYTDTHPRGAVAKGDPREGHAQAAQGSMFGDPDSIEKAPATPYAGGHGHSGTDTSKARADRGLGKSQAAVANVVHNARGRGATVAELRGMLSSMHHGTISGALTELHKVGVLSRLVEKRGRCHVYVIPEYINGRDTEKPKGTKAGLAARVMSAQPSGEGLIRLDGIDYYLAEDLLDALMEGYEA